MKRGVNAIVHYDSSSDNEIPSPPPPKKRQAILVPLPSLSPNLVVPTPVDNPALHQGRIRTTPHVDGNWAAHVYVSINLNRSHALYSLLSSVITQASQSVPTLHNLVMGQDRDKNYTELHISLTRPIFIRAHQKEDLRQAVKKLAQRSPFTLSFTSFAELHNDENTRTFLTMEVGAGHHELKKLCGDLEPFLQGLRQHSYYSSPRFHASIAWALLDQVLTSAKTNAGPPAIEAIASPTTSSSGDQMTASSPEPQIRAQFDTVPGLPEELIRTLNHQFVDRLSSPMVGSFDVNNLAVRIGKEIVLWPFSGV
ncbi:hypothetical protein P691DRAFT_655574 [Macrolepiota fuliginosa MF-IS2]|uniref:U6 snRNA phosphodiesterase 1 n=1 Tax=Macrolepiota fuliginosa MF-IS2 TaxID=1400762 RepID=A0A9P6C783_9AGAR|nr:hypothetical protein P691DRAFT_655574 [Macrolepiota fuliginosa MF-IS2]